MWSSLVVTTSNDKSCTVVSTSHDFDPIGQRIRGCAGFCLPCRPIVKTIKVGS